MSSAKVLLYTSKTLKNGEHPIMLRVTKDRKTSYLSLKASSTKKLWNEEENLPKKKHPLYKEILILIDRKKLEANKLLLTLDAADNDYSLTEVRKELKRTTGKQVTIFKYFDEVIKRLNDTNKIGYANVFTSTRNSIKKFSNGNDINFTSVDINFLRTYDEYLLKNNVSLNSIFVYMRTFKTLINYAKGESLIKKEFDPFDGFSFKKYRRVKTKKRAITKEQMLLIINYEPTPGTHQFDSKNYFVFSFFARGMNFIDIAHLKWKNIKNNRLIYTRRKTNENFSIELNNDINTILSYYKPYQKTENSYIFPILTEKHVTAKSIDYRTDKVLKWKIR